MEYIEHDADTWRVKASKKKQKSPLDCCPSPNKPKQKKKSKCCAKKKPSFDTVKHSVSAHCCACCCILAQYMRESCKLVCSCLSEKPTETKVCEVFAQLIKATSALATDIWHLLRMLCRFLTHYKK